MPPVGVAHNLTMATPVFEDTVAVALFQSVVIKESMARDLSRNNKKAKAMTVVPRSSVAVAEIILMNDFF